MLAKPCKFREEKRGAKSAIIHFICIKFLRLIATKAKGFLKMVRKRSKIKLGI